MNGAEKVPESKDNVLICFAVKEEAAAFRKALPHFSNARILVFGMGRLNAEHAIRKALDDRKPSCVLTCGFAGGLNPALDLGSVIFETSDAVMRQKLLGTGARPARFFCADRIATTVDEKQKLRGETGADAVEMESAAIHAICREHVIPCATVRVISDTATENLPLDFNTLSKPDMSLDYGKLARAIARSPGKIIGLLKLQRNTRFAAARLVETLLKFLEAVS